MKKTGNTIKDALTRKFGPLPAWAYLAAFAIAVYWWRNRGGGSSSSSAGASSGGVDLGTLADLGYTAVPSQELSGSGGGGSSGGSGSTGSQTGTKHKKKPPRPKRRHTKPKAHKNTGTPVVHRPKRPAGPKGPVPPVHHPRARAHDASKTGAHPPARKVVK